ncbi:hypothetical protein H5410_010050 [Solanum commersonii]|uniref:Uncharacterized protein n=1 Tax=Solanum commersonii TaxID=4109 RepID=A0A9J6AJM4_SOLCO|nr:hypothetical protein H5410_010050 [Solanum commersonii]
MKDSSQGKLRSLSGHFTNMLLLNCKIIYEQSTTSKCLQANKTETNNNASVKMMMNKIAFPQSHSVLHNWIVILKRGNFKYLGSIIKGNEEINGDVTHSGCSTDYGVHGEVLTSQELARSKDEGSKDEDASMMCRHTMRDGIRNKNIRVKVGVTSMVDKNEGSEVKMVRACEEEERKHPGERHRACEINNYEKVMQKPLATYFMQKKTNKSNSETKDTKSIFGNSIARDETRA